MKPIQYIAIGCILASLLVCAFIVGRATAPKTPVEPLSRDTVIVTRTDTIVREKPVYYSVTRVDTLRVPVVDTLRLRDTLWLEIPKEQRAYRDSLYEAWVSGYDPALDSIRIFAPVQTITVTEKVPVMRRTHWGIGISGGWGVTLVNGQIMTGPTISVTASYNFLTW